MLDHTTQGTTTDKTFDKLESKVLEVHFGSSAKTEYFIAETGSGKSEAIERFVKLYGNELRIAIVLNSKRDVERRANNLKSIKGLHVESYLSEKNNTYEKSDLKSAQVAIVTHQFFNHAGNRNYLGERDIFIVDETPVWEKIRNFTVDDLQNAQKRSQLDRSTLKPVRDSIAWLTEVEPKSKYLPITEAEYPVLFEGLRLLAEEGDYEARKVLQAAEDRTAILYTDRYMNPNNSPVTILYPLSNPLSNEKVLIVSATAHLEGGQLQHDKPEPVNRGDYKNLQLCLLNWPDMTTEVKKATQDDKDTMFDIVEQILREEIKGETLIVTYRAWEGRFIDRLEQMSDDFGRADEVKGHKVHITYHGTDVGSNEYRECKNIIYIGLHNIPEYVDLAEVFYHTGQRVTEASLQQVRQRGGMLSQLRNGKRGAELKQMVARGCCRQMSNDGVAEPMNAWLIVPSDKLPDVDLDELFPHHVTILQPASITYKKRKDHKIQTTLLEILEGCRNDIITNKEVEEAYKKRRGIKTPFINKNAQSIPIWLEGSGWRYEVGKKGGRQGCFMRLK